MFLKQRDEDSLSLSLAQLFCSILQQWVNPNVGPSPKSKVGITHFQLFCKFMVGRVPEKWGRCQVEQVSCGYFKSINPPLFGEGPTVGITDSGKIWHNNWGWGVGKVIGRAPPSGQCLPCFAEQLGLYAILSSATSADVCGAARRFRDVTTLIDIKPNLSIGRRHHLAFCIQPKPAESAVAALTRPLATERQ